MIPLLVAIFITVSDQFTKQLVRDSFFLGESRVIIDGFFSLTYVRNTGAAWGMFGGQNMWLSLLSIVMLAIMVIFRRSFLSDTWDHKVALGLMVGGIVGNLLDRVRLAYVTDFLDFYIGHSHWPAFNIADSGICIGVGIYVLTSLKASRQPTSTEDKGRTAEASGSLTPET